MADSSSNLDTISASQASKEVTANALYDAGSPATLYGRRASTTSGLTWGFYGGKFRKSDGSIATIANGTVTLTNGATNYLYADSAGVVTKVTAEPSGWPGPLLSNAVALYQIVVSGGSVTGYTDYRTTDYGIGGGGGGGTEVADGDYGDITVGGSPQTWTIDNNAVSYAKMQDVSATKRVIGRNTAGSGDPEEVTVSQLLDWAGTAAQGDILYRNATSWVLLPAGTSGHFLKTQGAGANPIWDASSGGLTNWTEAISTSAPNATIPAVSFTATNAAASVDSVLRPKGNGCLLAAVPDNASTGGNKRGTNSVDWQIARTGAAQVASGGEATIAGGRANTASGSQSTVGGGAANTASNTNSTVVGGLLSTASGNAATAGGSGCVASGNNSVAFGSGNQATGTNGVALGDSNTASGSYSGVPQGRTCTASGDYSYASGRQATTRSLIGAVARASGQFAAVGDLQEMSMVLRGSTTDATPKVLTSDAAAAGTTNQLVLQNNSAMTVTGKVVSRANASGDTASWTFTASIKRGANAAATAMVAAATVTSVAADAGAASWALAVTADTTNGALKVEFTGAAATNIRVGCSLEAIECQG